MSTRIIVLLLWVLINYDHEIKIWQKNFSCESGVVGRVQILKLKYFVGREKKEEGKDEQDEHVSAKEQHGIGTRRVVRGGER